jgi:hypothetical protein
MQRGGLMDWLPIVANMAQIVGVAWALLFGGKSVIDVINMFRGNISIRINRFVLLSILYAVILVVLLGMFVRPILIPIPNAFSPSASSPGFGTLNLQLACQNCGEPGVAASIISYSTDPPGSTSLTGTFTNHTNSAVNLKVDTIKLLDQNGNLIPVLSSDPYVGIAAGQTIPTTINFSLMPQRGTKYTFSIVMEEADVFTNFYQSPAFSFT